MKRHSESIGLIDNLPERSLQHKIIDAATNLDVLGYVENWVGRIQFLCDPDPYLSG